MNREPELPRLEQLGAELSRTSCWRRRIALARPFLCAASVAFAAQHGSWWLAGLALFCLFISIVAVTHDVVHGSLGLSPRATHAALFAIGALVLESGHAYRSTHLRHHQVFPGPDDPEGDPARMSFAGAILHGPVFLPRLWWWAWRRSSGRSSERAWLFAEAVLAAGLLVGSLAHAGRAPVLATYVLLVIAGSWTYPLLTVHLPHHDYGPTRLQQTRTLRGRILPALCLELTYHLEHHLYPEVPSHHLAGLSRKLDPWLRAAGVRPARVP